MRTKQLVITLKCLAEENTEVIRIEIPPTTNDRILPVIVNGVLFEHGYTKEVFSTHKVFHRTE